MSAWLCRDGELPGFVSVYRVYNEFKPDRDRNYEKHTKGWIGFQDTFYPQNLQDRFLNMKHLEPGEGPVEIR